MIVVDASVWTDHIRVSDAKLSQLLIMKNVLAHPFVTGEVSLGQFRNRELISAEMQKLPQAAVATDAEVLRFIERYKLSGQGIGYVDAHLLAAVSLTPDASLWTRDKRLEVAAARLRLNASL